MPGWEINGWQKSDGRPDVNRNAKGAAVPEPDYVQSIKESNMLYGCEVSSLYWPCW